MEQVYNNVVYMSQSLLVKKFITIWFIHLNRSLFEMFLLYLFYLYISTTANDDYNSDNTHGEQKYCSSNCQECWLRI